MREKKTTQVAPAPGHYIVSTISLIILVGIAFKIYKLEERASPSFNENDKSLLLPPVLPKHSIDLKESQAVTPQAFNGSTKKLYETAINGPVSLSTLSKPGYYTIVLFSATWCKPCKILWDKMPRTIAEFPNVVAVEVNVDSLFPENKESPSAKFLAEMGVTSLPAAFILNPYGQTTKWGSGQDEIESILLQLAKRELKQPMAMETVTLR